MTSFEASKKVGIVFRTSGCSPSSASASVLGVRKSVATSHTASLSSSSTARTPSVPNVGAPTNALRVQPCAPGVSTDRRFLTSSSTLSTR